MKLLVLTVLLYVTATSAQRLGNLGVIGADVGGRVGTGVGLGVGTVLDTVPRIAGVGSQPTAPLRPIGPRGGEAGGRNYERGSSSINGREYEREGAGGEYARGGSYSRDKMVNERERGSGYESGRGWRGNERGRAGSRSDSYGRENSDYARQY